MTYVTVSSWEWDPGADIPAMEEYVSRAVGSLKQQGAVRGYNVRTSDRTGIVVVVYPDKATYDKVSGFVAKARSDAGPQLGIRMTGTMAGEVTVEV